MTTTTLPLPPYLELNYRALADPLQKPLDRLSALTSVRVNLEDAAFTLVHAARAAGASWTEIGLRLGVTKQAAHQRFGMGLPADD